jgi:hypothetical protein
MYVVNFYVRKSYKINLTSRLLGCDVVSLGSWFPPLQIVSTSFLSFETSEAIHSNAQCHVPEDLKLQQEL